MHVTDVLIDVVELALHVQQIFEEKLHEGGVQAPYLVDEVWVKIHGTHLLCLLEIVEQFKHLLSRVLALDCTNP